MKFERSFAVGLSLLIIACGGGEASNSSPTGPENTPQQPSPGSPSTLTVVSGNQQTGTVDGDLADPVVATVVDADGQAVPNTTVSWEVTAGGGSVFASATSSGADGQTQNIWTLGTVAGEQKLEVRWVDPSSGEAIVLGSFTATATPGPAASLILESPSKSILRAGESFQIVVSGEDEFGNAIASEDVNADWSSADASIATVDAAGLVTATAGGSTLVEAMANGASVSVRVLVNQFETTVYPHSGEYPFELAESGGRLLSVFLGDAGRTVQEFVNGAWVLQRTGYGFGDISGLGSGEFLLVEDQLVSEHVDAVIMVSSSPGSWIEDRTTDWVDPHFTRPLDGEIVVHTLERDSFPKNGEKQIYDAPAVWMRSLAGSWQDLGHPSSKGGRFLQGVSGHFLASDEVYWCGLSEENYGSGNRIPEASYWDGASWNFLGYSGFTQDVQQTTLYCTGTDLQAGVGYGIIHRKNGPTEVVQLAAGVVSPVPSVQEQTYQYLTEITVAQSGGLLLTFVDPRNEVPLEPNLQMENSDGTWTPYWLPDGWDVSGKPLIDSAGRIWFGAYKRYTDEAATYVLTP